MPLLFDHDEEVIEWAERKLDGKMVFPHSAIGILDKSGVLRGAWLLAFYNPWTAELTLYSEGVTSNDAMKACFAWTFHLAAANCVFALRLVVVAERNIVLDIRYRRCGHKCCVRQHPHLEQICQDSGVHHLL